MKEHIEKKYIISERILSLKNLSIETERNITHLNVLVSERITARDNEIKKKKTIEENIGKLEVALKKLIKSNEESGDK
jgi:hypothetical protein